MKPVDIVGVYEPANVVSLCRNYTRDLFLWGTLPSVNIGIQPERTGLIHAVPAAVRRQRAVPRRGFETCPVQNEEFCANKAKGINRRILMATFVPGGFRNLDSTRATLSLAFQKEQ